MQGRQWGFCNPMGQSPCHTAGLGVGTCQQGQRLSGTSAPQVEEGAQ